MTQARAPAEAFPPGNFIREELEARGWTDEELARKTKFSLYRIREILDGRRRITRLLSYQLGQAFNVDERLFSNLEATWQRWKAGAK